MLAMWNSAPKAHEFLGWTRFLIGWLQDSQINCQDTKDVSWKTLNLKVSPIERNSDETKLALIKLSETQAIAIESRRNLGFDRIPEEFAGTLVYLVDVTKGSNEGMASLITSNTATASNGTSIGTMKVGSKVDFAGLRIEIIYSDESGDYVRISRTAVDPQSSPQPTPTSVESWEKLRQDVQTRYLERSKSGRFFDFEFILSPTVNRAKAQETMDAYREASRNWTWLFEPTATYSIVWVLLTEKDYDWWYAKVTELQGKNSIYPWDKAKNEFGHCGLSDQAFCGYGNTQEAPDGKMKLFQYNVIGSNFQGKPVANTVHHESVHFYQLANNLTYPRDLPCSYIEGQATFYGNVISRTNDSSYERSRIIVSLPNSRNWTVAEWVDFLKSIQGNRDECLKDSRNYSIGSFLWEYLLLNYTEEELHKAHIALKTKTWADVALSVLRKSADQLTTEFANHLTTIFSRK
jgi:hypothetical protein